MRISPLLALAASLALGSCAAVQSGNDDLRYGFDADTRTNPQGRISGIIGVTELSQDTDTGSSPESVAQQSDFTMPMIGAAWQKPLNDKRLELGAEAGFSLGWDSDRTSVAVGNGTVVVLANNNVRLFDVSIGAYASRKLGDRWRLYGGIGPLLQWASVDLEFDELVNGRDGINENGFGYGYYTRVGLELEVQRGMGVGLVARWVDSKVDLGGLLGDTDLEAIQVGLVVTSGF